jgi:hypothetical protein
VGVRVGVEGVGWRGGREKRVEGRERSSEGVGRGVGKEEERRERGGDDECEEAVKRTKRRSERRSALRLSRGEESNPGDFSDKRKETKQSARQTNSHPR